MNRLLLVNNITTKIHISSFVVGDEFKYTWQWNIVKLFKSAHFSVNYLHGRSKQLL